MLAIAPAMAADGNAQTEAISDGALISEVRIQRQNVFNLENEGEDNALYRWVNRLHIVTREKTVAKQLLFADGEVYDKQRLEETERLLRSNAYFYDAAVEAAPQADGSVAITVKTRDLWTLLPELSLSRSGGENSSSLGIEEKNLFGYGQRILLSRDENVDRNSKRFEFFDRQLGRSWVTVALRIADNSDGFSNFLSVAKPFQSLDSRWTAGGFVFDDDRRSTLYELGERAAEFRHERDTYRIFGGWSAGLENGWVRRWTTGIAFDDNRFSAVPVPTLPAQIPDDRKLVYPFVSFEILEDRFEKSANSNQIERSEDFYFGKRVTATLGWSDERFDADRDALVYSLVANSGFGSMDSKALFLTANIDGRQESGVTANMTASINARYYSRQSSKRVFFATLEATQGHNLDLDNPLEIGGDTGLRGYPLRYQSGESRVLFTIEQRYFTDWYPFKLFRVGGAVFFDAGRSFGTDPLGSPNLGWLKDVGFGFRFAPTRLGSGKIVHLDIAFPLDGDPTIDTVQILLKAKRSF